MSDNVTVARKHFVDNLRWLAVLLLIPYHAAMAWNAWGESNYIFFEGNKAISSLVVFFSPYYMPLLFLLAGMSTRYALSKRTYKQYVVERVKRLFVPLLFGIIAFMPIMAFMADKFSASYQGSFLQHYPVFFTKYTDYGGFTLGQFWFLLYLFVISLIAVGIIAIQRRFIPETGKKAPFWCICLLGLPLPALNTVLSIGGKSLAEYTYIFLIGYSIFSSDATIEKLGKYRYFSLCIGLFASILDVYLFLWSEVKCPLLNIVAKYIAEWFMLLALVGIGKKNFDFSGKIPSYMSKRSFPFFSFHFVWLVLFQYWTSVVFADNIVFLYFMPIILAYIFTFLCCEICLRVPLLSFLLGTKYISRKL